MKKHWVAVALIAIMMVGLVPAMARADNLTGDPWIDKIGRTLFAPFRVLCVWDRYSAAYAASERTGNLRYWDGLKGILNLDLDYAQNTVGAVVNVFTPWTPRDFTTDWSENTSLSVWGQKSDMANAFKLVALGTTFGFAVAETPIFFNTLAEDIGVMYGISEGGFLTTRLIETFFAD